MAKHLVLLLLTMAGITTAGSAQEKDPVLFTVADAPVHVSEFDYIYSKTNGKNADYSRKSLEEYLDLYIKFKLKVQKAKDLQLDTIQQLNDELAGYRRQLADSYLIDQSVTEKLSREAYERVKQDVDISHIMVGVPPNAAPADTLEAFLKIQKAKERIEGGEDFATVAKEVSSDKSAQRNGGHVGYVTALFPQGLYQLETAAYTAPAGKLAGPIRSGAGYHLVQVHDRRPARGEMEVAHILLRTKDRDPAAVKTRIDSIYGALQNGANFEELAKSLSEDAQSAARGGYIGFFGINRFERAFEDAAFALKADGDYTKPAQTSIGWHIIRRISKKDIQPYEVEKGRLEAAISKDNRFALAREAMLKQIIKESNFRENKQLLDEFVSSLPDTFLTFKWKVPANPSTEVLFTLGENFTTTLGDFTDFLGRSTRKRLSMGRNSTASDAAMELYRDFVDERLLKFEESRLEEKHPDFKALMREYEEGILLFEATKMLVWDKASQDTVGLEQFFKTIDGKYRWNERAVTSIYRISAQYKDQVEEIRAYAAGHSPEEVQKKFNSDDAIVVNVEEKTFEKGRHPEIADMAWQEGALSETEENARSRTIRFHKFEKLLPVGHKSLQEARGYVVADYQDFLEKQWIEELRKEYKVKVNEKVFESLVKS